MDNMAEIVWTDAVLAPWLDLDSIGVKIANEEGLSRPLLTAIPFEDEWEDSSVWDTQSTSREGN